MAPRRSAGRARTTQARGLCWFCYRAATKNGELFDYPRSTRSRDEVLDEWEMLRGEGYTRRQAAERIGMTFEAFDRALYRARSAGDPRAVWSTTAVQEWRRTA
jgi:hypothetical protein